MSAASIQSGSSDSRQGGILEYVNSSMGSFYEAPRNTSEANDAAATTATRRGGSELDSLPGAHVVEMNAKDEAGIHAWLQGDDEGDGEKNKDKADRAGTAASKLDGGSGSGSGGSGRRGSVRLRRTASMTENMSKAAKARIAQHGKFRAEMREFMDDPYSSISAMGFAVFICLVIVTSVVFFCLETVDAYQNWGGLEVGEYVFNIIFTVEYFVRCYMADEIKSVFGDIFMYIDFVAVAPFWLEKGLASSSERRGQEEDFLNVLKAFRCLRLLKLVRQYRDSVVLVRAFAMSAAALVAPFFFLTIAVVLLATVCFFAEESYYPGRTFQNIPEAIWFMVVTMTTVGYGDVTPRSTPGRLLAGFASLFGVIFLSMPIAIVGNNFVNTWAGKEKVVFVERLRHLLNRSSLRVTDVKNIFNQMDSEGKGEIGLEEFHAALKSLKINIGDHEIHLLFKDIDDDNSGTVSVDEFISLIFPDMDEDEIKSLCEAEEAEDAAREETRAASPLSSPLSVLGRKFPLGAPKSPFKNEVGDVGRRAEGDGGARETEGGRRERRTSRSVESQLAERVRRASRADVRASSHSRGLFSFSEGAEHSEQVSTHRLSSNAQGRHGPSHAEWLHEQDRIQRENAAILENQTRIMATLEAITGRLSSLESKVAAIRL